MAFERAPQPGNREPVFTGRNNGTAGLLKKGFFTDLPRSVKEQLGMVPALSREAVIREEREEVGREAAKGEEREVVQTIARKEAPEAPPRFNHEAVVSYDARGKKTIEALPVGLDGVQRYRVTRDVRPEARPPPEVQREDEKEEGREEEGGVELPMQTKLRVSSPDDPAERAADEVADRVMTMPLQRQGASRETVDPEPETVAPKASPGWASPEAISTGGALRLGGASVVGREAAKGEEREEVGREASEEDIAGETMQRQAGLMSTAPPAGADDDEEDPKSNPLTVQRQAAPDEETIAAKLQRKGDMSGATVDAGTAAQINSVRNSGGQPLAPGDRAFFEERMDADFSNVRIHTNAAANESASAVQARAFTLGRDIVFNQGEYRPETSDGKRLLAHELTHTIQQGAAVSRSVRLQRYERPRHSFLQPQIQRSEASPFGAIGNKVEEFAEQVPGYKLFKVLLGRSPVTFAPVQRTPDNLVSAVTEVVPGGQELYDRVKKGNAVQPAFQKIQAAWRQTGITFDLAKRLIRTAYDRISVIRGITYNKNVIQEVFGPTFQKIKQFALTSAGVIKEAAFRGLLAVVGAPVERVMQFFTRARGVLGKIFHDPIGFGKNLIGAVKQGFSQFSTNFVTHMKSALFGWMFGTLQQAGIQIPETFDLPSIFKFVSSVLGFAYQNLRAKLVRKLGPTGERVISTLESGFEYVKILVTEGPAGLWDHVKEDLSGLKDNILGGVLEWVRNTVIVKAVMKIASMLNPAGAIVQAVLAIYNTVMFFMERFEQIRTLAESVMNSVDEIANGRISAAANYVEQSMGRGLTVVISFLARLIGLGGLSGHIKRVLDRMRRPIDRAIDKALNFVVTKAKAWLARLRGRGDEDESGARGPADFEVRTPFAMEGESHHIIGRSRAGELEFSIASVETRLRLALQKAIEELQGSDRPDKSAIIAELKRTREYLDEAQQAFRMKAADLYKGATTAQAREAVLEKFVEERAAQAANGLRSFAARWKIKSLEEFYAAPPEKRYLSEVIHGKVGDFIRTKLYEIPGNWTRVSAEIHKQEKPNLIAAVKAAQAKALEGDRTDWERLKVRGLILKDAEPENYDPEKVAYSVDHRKAISTHWNEFGKRADDATRLAYMEDRSNLQLVTKEYNSAKGGEDYDAFVTATFTSDLAESGLKNAKRIAGKPFVDAAGLPIG